MVKPKHFESINIFLLLFSLLSSLKLERFCNSKIANETLLLFALKLNSDTLIL